ncbi:MAG: A/G-specific adenine glycosylase [Phycisphaerales bacterium]|nr:A/G-specific adenine glycosylase [Phycisphaerales bacterium]
MLPWRAGEPGSRDPYLVLVSEAMLQQTQVSRVEERFPAFTRRFPTVEALAEADVDDVLAEWSGMGYYRRARNLHAAARMIAREKDGVFPRSAVGLRELPGIGRYTAGAIASIAFDLPEPIVDGNVARVLQRVHGRDAASDDRAAQAWLWERAGAIAGAGESAGAVNEAMMELGATVCVPPPASPRCDACPLRGVCVARQAGTQMSIPRPKSRPGKKALYCAAAVLTREDHAILVEQRPMGGMWGGLWQAPTIESSEAPPTAPRVAAALGLSASMLRPEASFEHQTTHRRVLFQVWRAAGGLPPAYSPPRGIWMRTEQVERLALSNAQRRILLESEVGGTLFG